VLDEIEAGKSFKTPGRPAEPDEWGVIKVSAMTWGEFDESENKAVLDVERINPRYQIERGDLLLSRANTSELVGATVLVGDRRDRLLLSDKSMRLITKPEVDRRWLRYCLGSPALRAQMSAVATGTSDSMRNISQAKVRALRVRVPTPSAQKEIADRISERLAAATRLSRDAELAGRKLLALRRSILAAAFSGRLVPQDPADEPESALLERGVAERVGSGRPRRWETSSL
jgi:type I restriction enzyme S subunit